MARTRDLIRRCPGAVFLAFAAASPVLAADTPTVEKCNREMGSLAVAEPQSHHMAGLRSYGLGSPAIMLRMIVQESGCFAVVERGVAMQNLREERALAAGGQLQADANIGGGQMQGADFVMTPAVQFSGETGGVGGAVGNLLGRAGGALGALGGLAGGVKFKEAETSLLIADVRSSIQVASAEGKASKMNFSLGGWGWGGLGWAAGGGYSKTPEGKLIAASLLDNYNKIVVAIRDKPSLIRSTSEAARANAAQSIQATTPGAARAPAPAPMATAGAGALPAGYFGAYNGQVSGADQGTFSIVVSPIGQVSGFGQASGIGNFNVSGTVAANGSIVMSGTASGGQTQFNGFLNPATGELIGTWRMPSGAQGMFQGKRQ
jgi:curli biogenesis system outer membrane secretion channel CsgG